MSIIARIAEEHQKFLQLSGGKARIKAEPGNSQDKNQDGFVSFLEYLESSGKFTRQQIEKAQKSIINDSEEGYIECNKEKLALMSLLSKTEEIEKAVIGTESPCQLQAFDFLLSAKPSLKFLLGFLPTDNPHLRRTIADKLIDKYSDDLSRDDWFRVLYAASPAPADQLVGRILAKNPSKDTLIRLSRFKGSSGKKIRGRLWEMLNDFDNLELEKMVRISCGELQKRSFGLLLKRAGSGKNLGKLVVWSDNKEIVKKSFVSGFLKASPSKQDLIDLIITIAVYRRGQKHLSRYKMKAWQLFKGLGPSNLDLAELLERLLYHNIKDPVIDLAMKLFFSRKPDLLELAEALPKAGEIQIAQEHINVFAQYLFDRISPQNEFQYGLMLVKIINWAGESYRSLAIDKLLAMDKEEIDQVLDEVVLEDPLNKILKGLIALGYAPKQMYLERTRQRDLRSDIIKLAQPRGEEMFLPTKMSSGPSEERIGLSGKADEFIWHKMVSKEDRANFKKLYYAPYFNKKIKSSDNFTWFDAISFGVAVMRFIEKFEGANFDDAAAVRRSIDFVFAMREKFKKKIIIEKDTRALCFAGEEEHFDLGKLEALVMESGASLDAKNKGLKGHGVKDKVLKAVSGMGGGKKTLIYQGHGNRQALSLGSDVFGIDFSGVGNENRIHFRELARAFLGMKDYSDAVLILASCESYNYGVSFLNSLKGKSNKQLPVVITIANKNKPGFGGGFLNDDLLINGVLIEHAPGTDLSGEHFLNAEKFAEERENPAFFVPVTNEDLEGFGFSEETRKAVLNAGYVEVS